MSHSIHSPCRNFQNLWSNGKCPLSLSLQCLPFYYTFGGSWYLNIDRRIDQHNIVQNDVNTKHACDFWQRITCRTLWTVDLLSDEATKLAKDGINLPDENKKQLSYTIFKGFHAYDFLNLLPDNKGSREKNTLPSKRKTHSWANPLGILTREFEFHAELLFDQCNHHSKLDELGNWNGSHCIKHFVLAIVVTWTITFITSFIFKIALLASFRKTNSLQFLSRKQVLLGYFK